MKGAAPVPARKISRPTKSSTTTIGVIHQALLCNKKSTSSRNRLGEVCSAWREKSSDLVIRLALDGPIRGFLNNLWRGNACDANTVESSGLNRDRCGVASSKSLPFDRRHAPSDLDRLASL